MSELIDINTSLALSSSTIKWKPCLFKRKMTKYSLEQDLGCGLMGGLCHTWSTRSRKSLVQPALAAKGVDNVSNEPITAKSMKPCINDSRTRQPRNSVSISISQQKKDSRTASDAARSSASSSSQDLTIEPKLHKQKPNNSKALMGNIIRQPSPCGEFKQYSMMDPEALKKMGNVAYKKGRFKEALTFYKRAISLDSKQATYRCNKSDALLRLGRVLEAVVECKEAVQLDPTYCRAHHRLATVYLRLGEATQALNHYKQAGNLTDSNDIAKAQGIIQCLKRCMDARKSNQWNTILKETRCAIITYGVDSAPEVYALQTEAFLKLHRHQEAFTPYSKGPNFTIESCINFFGMAVSAYILMIKALVYMVSGRVDDAVSAAQHAARLDPGNKEITLVVKRTRAVSSARLSGNLLYKASKFSEACIVYSEGLEHDPYNPVLLCNRAACRCKLGQFEKVIGDCTMALNVQPSYSKARRRRADCNAKLERWEVAIRDYEMLIRKNPGDDEVARAMFEAHIQLKNTAR